MYPSLLRSSLLVSCISFFERSLIRLCNEIYSQRKLKLCWNDIDGKGVEKAQKYLKKYVGVAFPDDSPEWRDILIFQHIRNLVVHQGSIYKDVDRK